MGLGGEENRPVLIERETEMSVLSELVDDALSGHGGAVLIDGEPGIGKTRLLAFARARAKDAGAVVLFATADEPDAAVPLGIARALLWRAARAVEPDGPASLGVRALAGALAEPAGPGSRGDEVVHALWWLIVELCDRGPLVLALDDAHWADELTVKLLRLTARRASELPLAMVVAARQAARGGPHAVLAGERAFVRLEPAPLSVAGTGRLVCELLGRPGELNVVARLRALTRGNPLYLRELVDALRGRGADLTATTPLENDVPTQLVALVADRLHRLPSAAAELARALAVLGGDASPARARRLGPAGCRERGGDLAGGENSRCRPVRVRASRDRCCGARRARRGEGRGTARASRSATGCGRGRGQPRRGAPGANGPGG